MNKNHTKTSAALAMAFVIAMIVMAVLAGLLGSGVNTARTASPAVAAGTPTFSLTPQYSAVKVSITNETTIHSGTINYVVHYDVSGVAITNKTANITTKNGADIVEISLLVNETVYVAVDSVNGTAYSTLAGTQSSTSYGVFSFAISKELITQVKNGTYKGDWNITIPIGTETGATFNGINLYIGTSNVSDASTIPLILVDAISITKNANNWTFNDVSLSGTNYLYPQFLFEVSSGGPFNQSLVTAFGTAKILKAGGGVSVGFLFVNGNSAMAFIFGPTGIAILVVVLLLLIYLFARHERREGEK